MINGGSGNGGRRRNQRHPGQYDPFSQDFGTGFFNFSFRDPDDVFREFFNTSDITDLLFPGKYRIYLIQNALILSVFLFIPSMVRFCLGQRFNGHGHHEVSAMMNPFGFGGFGGGFGSGFDNMFSMVNSGYAPGGHSGNMKRTSISTRFANGKKITTKRYLLEILFIYNFSIF